jgi:hypothetical protein
MRSARPAFSSSLAAYVRGEWANWFEDEPPILEWVLQATGRPIAQTSVMVHAVDARSGDPRLVAKVNRDRAMAEIVENEFWRQSEAHQLLPGSVARPLGLVDVAGDLHIVAQFAPNSQPWSAGQPGWRREQEDVLASWLAKLHDKSQRPRSGGGDDAVTDVQRAFVETFTPPLEVQSRLGEATELVRQETQESSSEILVHGDFWSGNWLFGDSGFTVIDWEHASWRSSSFLDEFLHPLSELTHGEAAPAPDRLGWLSDAYRRQRGIATRSDEDCLLGSIWTAAEVATRTYRRWGVVEDWSHTWARLTESLAEIA